MEPDDYCEIFCSHFLNNQSPRLNDYIGDLDELFLLNNGDGLEFGTVERHHCPLMGTNTIIYHFKYLHLASHTKIFVTAGFRIAITMHHVNDLEIEDNCL